MNPAADPTAAFLAAIRQSNLLPADRLDDLAAWVAAQRADVQTTAKELFRRAWLTPYQIKEIFKGNGKNLTFGPYVLLDLLGEGGMGRVFKAHQTRLGRDVALKIIRREKLTHPGAEARFNHEVEALAKMTHPNVVTVYDADKVGDIHFYSMELIDGIDLTKTARERGPLPVQEACEYVRLAALGLQHAHEKGLVHRDIKPSNIIVSRNGKTVKLVDLGLARLLDAAGGEEAARVTQDGFVIGTPDFLAPEQARNPGSVDIRADIYALGGTLFYILTGKVPFGGANPTEKLLRHCTEPPPSLLAHRPDAPPQLDHLIRWCMAKRPEDRPQTPLDLAIALASFAPPPRAGSGSFPIPQVIPRPVPVVFELPPPDNDPARSSQIFKLPAQVNDPIRRRGQRQFPLGPVLVGVGALFVAGILAYAAYRSFRTTDGGGSATTDAPPEESFTTASGPKMVRLSGGTFWMGSPPTEPGRPPVRKGFADEEGPRHEVTIRGPFFVSATEVTVGQFVRLMQFTAAARDFELPMRNVTHDEAVEFCKRLTEREKGQPHARKNWAYRLPTEAEWEYAARAGTDTPFAFGDRLFHGRTALFTHTETDPTGGGGLDNPPTAPGKVAAFEPNAWGLYDMHGNAAEWCSDWFKRGYPDGPRDNPTGPPPDDRRVVRGGSFRDPASACRSAARLGVRPADRRDTIGFRVVYAPIVK